MCLQKSSNDVRLGFIHNSQGEASDATAQLVATAIQVAMETMDAGMAKNFITKLLKEENIAALRSGEKTLEDLAVHVSQLNLAHRHHLCLIS